MVDRKVPTDVEREVILGILIIVLTTIFTGLALWSLPP